MTASSDRLSPRCSSVSTVKISATRSASSCNITWREELSSASGTRRGLVLFRGCPSESQHAARQSAPQSECSNWRDALVPVPENRNHNQDDRDNPQKHILCRIFFGCHGRSKPHPQFVSSPSFWPDFVTIPAPAQTSRPARGSRCQAFRRTRRRPTPKAVRLKLLPQLCKNLPVPSFSRP